MGDSLNTSLLAVDVGSSLVKLGWFPAAGDCATVKSGGPLAIAVPALPVPQETGSVEHRGHSLDECISAIARWVDGVPEATDAACLVGSVHPQVAAAVIDFLRSREFRRVDEVDRAELPLEVRVDEPRRVGVDRLVGAVAVNRLRTPGVPAAFVSMGTATTVNLVAADGSFEGGAIIAGSSVALAALHQATAALPDVSREMRSAEPTVVGKNTEAALRSGAFWGSIGAINELVRRLAGAVGGEAELFVTGGEATAAAAHIVLGQRRAKLVPHLVLAGLQLAAERQFAE